MLPSRRFCGGLALLLALVALVAGKEGFRDASTQGSDRANAQSAEDSGRDEQEPDSRRPTVEAAFAAESYRPQTVARLVLFDSAAWATLRLYRVGDAPGRLHARDLMRGTPVGRARTVRHLAAGDSIRIRLGRWRSGLYFAELRAPGGRVGYTPFVLAPARLGEHPIAVVMPTQTWQAYNFRDDDGDGSCDTWYAGPPHTTARLHRPFQNRGVPPHYRDYDEPFLRWLARNDYSVDLISDLELKRTNGEALARAYDTIVFSGHHEYVTTHEYDAVARYRDLGGSLIFLSANNFYAKITISGEVMTRVGWWRYLGRPEAALIGVQFFHNDLGEHRGPWTLRNTVPGRWIFAGAGLHSGDSLSSGGIEADALSTASPPGTVLLAEIENLYGPGQNAQMSYYRTDRGAQVFAAGAFSLACSIFQPPVSRLVTNLLTRFSE